MDGSSLADNPFAVLTFIAAPAVLTNATVVLASSAASRMLPTRRRMTHLVDKLDQGNLSPEARARLVKHANRVKTQAELLMGALYSIYVALGAFASATLVTLLGAVLASFRDSLWFTALIGLAILLGVVGVGSLVVGSALLFRATHLSLIGIREDARRINSQPIQ
jgi:type IV secretory pathway TrbD component